MEHITTKHSRRMRLRKQPPSLFPPVLGIRIRMFLSLPDPHPDQLVTSTDPAPDPSIINGKVVRKTLISTVL
jgi:hypothetical protein